MSQSTVKSRLNKRTRYAVTAAVGVFAICMMGLAFARSASIAEAPPHPLRPAALAQLPAVRVCWLEYARNDVSGQISTAGYTRRERWSVTVAGLLVRHPQGDVVVDVGNSSHFREEIEPYAFWPRIFLKLVPGGSRLVATAPEALLRAGADPTRLRWVILSHAHVDHAGGLVDLPRAPVLIPQAEIDYFASARGSIDVVPAHADTLAGRTTPLQFQPVPYENFDESADVFGDGSIVIVPLSGHTPGSVGTFVNQSRTRRFFHVGDAVNVMEAVERRVTKSIVMTVTDNQRPRADAVVAKIAQLHRLVPEITILPAHDRDAYKRAFGEPSRCVE